MARRNVRILLPYPRPPVLPDPDEMTWAELDDYIAETYPGLMAWMEQSAEAVAGLPD